MLLATITFVQAVSVASTLETKRVKSDVLADRVKKAAMTCGTLADFGEALLSGMAANTSDVRTSALVGFLALEPSSTAILAWLREHANIAAMLAFMAQDDIRAVVEQLSLPEPQNGFVAPPRAPFDVAIKATCLSPLTHGADGKSGNSTLFRRIPVMRGGRSASLPYYAGNAVRGQVRDALALHFAKVMGVDGKTLRLSNWFFHTIYAGGALEEKSSAAAAIDKRMGVGGTTKADAVREIRDMLPAISLLGCALGNRVIGGRVMMGDLRPRCLEWGTGKQEARDLMCWEYLTRRDDNEDRGKGDHHGMIANTECLKVGTVLDGGVDFVSHVNEMERSCLAFGLQLLAQKRYLGGENRRGLGMVALEYEGLPDGGLYAEYIQEHTEDIRQYLFDINALIRVE